MHLEGDVKFMKHFKGGGANYKSLGTSGLREEFFASARDQTPVIQSVVWPYTD
jgi:hypothetical protein